MLILVAVTITVALNSGLFGTARKAAYQTEIAEIQEQLEIAKAVKVAENGGEEPSDYGISVNDLSISDELKSKYGSKLVVSKNGTLYYDPEVVTDEEEQAWLEEIGIKAYAGEEEELTLLERYFLGEDGLEGQEKNLMDLCNIEDGTFKDDPNDATTNGVAEMIQLAYDKTITSDIIVEEDNICQVVDCYIKYPKTEERAPEYRVRTHISLENDTEMIIQSIDEVYTPESELEGEDLGKLKEGYDGWIILYDNGDGTVEAVSPTAMGDLSLGYSEGTTDETKQLEEAIVSYNNAIDTINNYCKEQITDDLATDENVRSVGAKTDPIPNVVDNPYNGIPAGWPNNVASYNGIGKNEDTTYEDDLARMIYYDKEFNILNVGKSYWFASRFVAEHLEGVSFAVRNVDLYDDLFFYGGLLWYVNSEGNADADSPVCAVRPIITVSL